MSGSPQRFGAQRGGSTASKADAQQTVRLPATASNAQVILFPRMFQNPPMVLVTVENAVNTVPNVTSITRSGFTLGLLTGSTGAAAAAANISYTAIPMPN